MVLLKGKSYQHVRSKEVFMKIHQILKEGSDYTKYYVEWINELTGVSLGEDVVTVKHCDMDKWSEV